VSKHLKIWDPFWLSAVLSIAGYRWGYALPGWLAWLTFLAVISPLCGVGAIRHTGIKFWSVAVVVVGLAIGQWWLIGDAFAIAASSPALARTLIYAAIESSRRRNLLRDPWRNVPGHCGRAHQFDLGRVVP